MHHTVHIGTGLTLEVKGVVASGAAQTPKMPVDGKFLKAMLDSIQAVASGKPDLLKQGSSQSPMILASGESVVRVDPAIADRPTESMPNDAGEPSSPIDSPAVEIAKDLVQQVADAAVTAVSAKHSDVAPPTRTGSVVVPKKGPQKEVPATVQGVTVAVPLSPLPEPRQVAGVSQVDIVAPDAKVQVLPEKMPVEIAITARPSIGKSSVALARDLKRDGKSLEVSAATTIHATNADLFAQTAAIPAQAPQHELGHSNNELAPLASIAVGSLSAHSPTAVHGVDVVKAAPVASARALVEASSQATDLKTLVATPNVLEVGVASGSHGWLRVRAEFSQSGEVAASVVAASASAAQGLHKEITGISAFLVGERVGVSTLVVNAAEKGAGAQDSILNNGTAGGATSEEGKGQRHREAQTPKISHVDNGNMIDMAAMLGISETNAPSVLPAYGAGSWLSVRV